MTEAETPVRSERLVAVVGATGTGKSALALELATRLDGEIVGADAMQLYRGMDIGTAKVPMHERRGIPHHLIDVLDPVEEATVAAYQRDARAAIQEIRRRGATPILVGGSGLYVSSVIQDFRFPPSDPAVRERLETELAAVGPAAMHARLAAVDPAAAGRVDPANGRRIVRALEVVELTGAFTPGLLDGGAGWIPTTVLVLEAQRAELVARLDERVLEMWRDGLVEEVRGLLELGSGLGQTASRAIGYAQALAELGGKIDTQEAIAETQALTRRYARRQVSWFRRYRSADALEVVRLDAAGPDLLQAALGALSHASGRMGA